MSACLTSACTLEDKKNAFQAPVNTGKMLWIFKGKTNK